MDRDAFAASLEPLGRRFRLPSSALDRLAGFGQLLATDPLAPTAVREASRIRDDHLADALVALELDVVRSARAIVDIGAGAGVPGLPLAIALPSSQVTLVEATGRKCQFIQRAITELGIVNARVVNARAESFSAGGGAFDLVTARALARPDVVAEYAAPLLTLGGSLVAWRGQPEPEVEAEAARAAEILGMSVEKPVRVTPYSTATARYLHVMLKVTETPAGFPRRPGVARKRPLGLTADASDRTRR